MLDDNNRFTIEVSGYGATGDLSSTGGHATAENPRTRRHLFNNVLLSSDRGFSPDFLNLAQNGNDGAACSGDSGGPAFYNGEIVGVVSWVAQGQNCMGLFGVYRLDVEDVIEWIERCVTSQGDDCGTAV